MNNEYKFNYSTLEKNSSNKDYGNDFQNTGILENSYRNDIFFELSELNRSNYIELKL